jgi:ribosomal protein L34E
MPNSITKMQKPHTEMTTKELAEATRQFDEPFVMDCGRPLNAAERNQHRLAAKRGRNKSKNRRAFGTFPSKSVSGEPSL